MLNNVKKIALNADLGEGMQNDEELISFLKFANIACGGHVGNTESISKTIQLAQKYGVLIGAHPSYPDKENFGRKSLQVSQTDLEAIILEQVSFFEEIANDLGTQMHHIKLHGALYNDVFNSKDKTFWFLDFMFKHYKGVKIFVPCNVQKYIKTHENTLIFEAFADRNYTNDLKLVHRSDANAILESPDAVYKHVKQMFCHNQVATQEGEKIKICADTFCLHGDHPNVVVYANKIHNLTNNYEF